ncbi:hypothetical protein FB639_004689, partial [Coemansia asiatica]
MDDSSLQRNKILVLGRSEVDKLAFVNSVIGETTDKEASESNSSTSAKVDWRIETRYFCVDVEFWIDSTEQLKPDHQ